MALGSFPLAISIISLYPWFTALKDIVKYCSLMLRNWDLHLLDDFCETMDRSIFPLPGERFRIHSSPELVLNRPDDHLVPLIQVNFASVFRALPIPSLMTVLEALLLEMRVIFVSSNLNMLTHAVAAVVGLLHPFEWQHILIPILPASMIDFVTAPMPYVVGVHASCLKQLKRLPLEECLIVDLSVGHITGMVHERFPPSLSQKVQINVRELFRPKAPVSNLQVFQAFQLLYLSLFGGIFKFCEVLVSPAVGNVPLKREVIFHEHLFLKSHTKLGQKFVAKCFESQLCHMWIEDLKERLGKGDDRPKSLMEMVIAQRGDWPKPKVLPTPTQLAVGRTSMQPPTLPPKPAGLLSQSTMSARVIPPKAAPDRKSVV